MFRICTAMSHFPVMCVLVRILAMCIYIYAYGTVASTKTETIIII